MQPNLISRIGMKSPSQNFMNAAATTPSRAHDAEPCARRQGLESVSKICLKLSTGLSGICDSTRVKEIFLIRDFSILIYFKAIYNSQSASRFNNIAIKLNRDSRSILIDV